MTSGPRGSVALLSTPDARLGDAALGGSQHPGWEQAVAARSVLRLAAYRPGRYAGRVRCPLMVMTLDDDQSVPAGPAARAADRAPKGELVRLPGQHYGPFTTAHEQAADLQVAFLGRHLSRRPARAQ